MKRARRRSRREFGAAVRQIDDPSELPSGELTSPRRTHPGCIDPERPTLDALLGPGWSGLQGGGILLLGATDSSVWHNNVLANQGKQVNSGGIVVVPAAPFTGGSGPIDHAVSTNTSWHCCSYSPSTPFSAVNTSLAMYRFKHRMISLFDSPSCVRRTTYSLALASRRIRAMAIRHSALFA
jgi:hypothetical protein